MRSGRDVLFEHGAAERPDAHYGDIVIDPDSHLVVVSPHPDDEIFSFGGALRRHVSAGGRSTILAVTDGEASDDGADAAMRRDLVVVRDEERREAFGVLGIADVEVVRLGFPDGDVTASEDELARVLRDLLRGASRSESAPPTVVGPWRFDRHPDHEAIGRATAEAALGLRVRCLEVPIWAWYDGGAAGIEGVGRRLLALALDGETRQRKRAAVRVFRSQLTVLASGRGPVLPEGFLDAFCGPFEPVLA